MKYFLIAASILCFTACGSHLTKRQPLCGGFTQQREPTVEEVEMFRSVTATVDTVFTPLSVSTQVVAGTNYRFHCRYEDTSDGIASPSGNNDRYGYCLITIFKPLPGRGEPTLTSISDLR